MVVIDVDQSTVHTVLTDLISHLSKCYKSAYDTNEFCPIKAALPVSYSTKGLFVLKPAEQEWVGGLLVAPF